MSAPWRCPVCHDVLALRADGRVWACAGGHGFDVAHQGYVNLLRQPRRRAAGDNAEMIAARGAFLATGAYQPISEALNTVCRSGLGGARVLDVGCGEGYYTRRLGQGLHRLGIAAEVSAIDVSKPAVAAAARQHRSGQYAVASAFDLPVPSASVDLAVSVFGPAAAEELARVVRPGGTVVAVHPGPNHLFALRQLIYDAPQPHDVKDPLRAAGEWFTSTARASVSFRLVVASVDLARQLVSMTPYRWHSPRDIDARLTAGGGLDTDVDVIITTYRRTSDGCPGTR